jgi:Immunoglobulin-like domain of bacterial spore germination/Sporulation and spore germination
MTDPERSLRAAFEAAASRVDVAPNALPAIRARVGVRARRRRMLTVSLAAAASVAVIAGGVAYALGRPAPVAQPEPAGSSVGVTQPSTPDTQPSSTATSPVPGVGVRVPVYFVGDSGKLFREFQFLTVPNDTLPERIQVAASRSVGGAAYDPDYDTAWPPEFGAAAARVDGEVATIELTGPAAPSNPIAAQQLVYTATAVAADRGTQLSGVRILVNGVPLPGGDQVRAPELETLAPLWLISPQQGETVGPDVDLHIAGTVYEATARIRIRDAGGAVVEDTFLTLDEGPPLRGQGHHYITLAPGRYTIEVFFGSPADGSEQGLDDHEITVS